MRSKWQNNEEIDWSLSEDEILHDLMILYGQDLLYLSYTYLKDKHLAEDAVQDVYIRCYNHLAKFRHDSSVKTWLYKITVNRCKDMLRGSSYRNINFNPFRMHLEKSNEPSIEDQFIKKRDSEALSRKVLELPVKYREVIILFYFEDLAIQDISSLLNLKVNSVKSRLHRGRKQLSQMYGERSEEGGAQLEQTQGRHDRDTLKGRPI